MEDLPFSTSPVNARPKSLLESGVGDSLRASAAGNSFAGAALGSLNAVGINGVTCGSNFDARSYTAKINHQNYLRDTTFHSPPPPVTESKIGRPETYGLARDFFKATRPRAYSAASGRISQKYAGINPGSLTAGDLFVTRKAMAEMSRYEDQSKLPGGENFKYGWKMQDPAKCGRGIDITAYMTSPSALLRRESYFDAHCRLCKEPEPVTSRICRCAEWERPVCKTCGQTHADGAVGGCEYAKAISDSYISKEKDSMYTFTVHNSTDARSHLMAAGARLRGAQNCENNCPVCHSEHYKPSDLWRDYMSRTQDRIHNHQLRSLMHNQSMSGSLHADRLPCRVCHSHHIIYTPRDNPNSHTLPGSCKVCGSYHSPGYVLQRTCRTAGMDSISRLQTIAKAGTSSYMDTGAYSMPHTPLSGTHSRTLDKSNGFGNSMSFNLGASTAPGTRRFSMT